MTSIRKAKKYNAKLAAQVFEICSSNCKVKHYSRFARSLKKRLRQTNPYVVWQQLWDDWQQKMEDLQRKILSDRVGGCFDVPELKYSREKTINGTGYGWQNSEGKKPFACCLGISPFLLYGGPTLSSLADDGLRHSSAGIPLEGKTVFDLTNQFIKIIKKQAEDDQ